MEERTRGSCATTKEDVEDWEANAVSDVAVVVEEEGVNARTTRTPKTRLSRRGMLWAIS